MDFRLPARTWHNGRAYDSKAIAGVAYGFEHPDKGWLRADEFSGGLRTLVGKLSKLGFVVVRDAPLADGAGL